MATRCALCRVAVGREEALEGLAADPSQLDGVAAVQCRGNFLFDPATHRDFLGAPLWGGQGASWWERRSPDSVAWCCAGPCTATHPAAPHAGACLGTGIERGKVGDILVTGEQGAQILCTPNLVEHLESALTQASSAGTGPRLAG